MTHKQLISQCFVWFWNTHVTERQMLFGVNNNSENRIVGAMNRQIGVTEGVLDFCYILPNATVFMDGKVGKDKLSSAQKEFTVKCADRGVLCFTFSSLREFQELIRNLQEAYLV